MLCSFNAQNPAQTQWAPSINVHFPVFCPFILWTWASQSLKLTRKSAKSQMFIFSHIASTFMGFGGTLSPFVWVSRLPLPSYYYADVCCYCEYKPVVVSYCMMQLGVNCKIVPLYVLVVYWTITTACTSSARSGTSKMQWVKPAHWMGRGCLMTTTQ